MNELETKILVHIRNHHRGVENAITFKNLSVELQINSRDLRQAVSDLVTRGEGTIGSNSVSGYFYCVTDEEVKHCAAELFSRGSKDFSRAWGLIQSRNRDKQEHPEQQRLFAEVK